MSKMKQYLEETGQLPMGTDEDGVVSMFQSDLISMEKEIEAYEDAVKLLRSHIRNIVLDNYLEGLYDLEGVHGVCCICDECIETYRKKTEEEH